MAGIEDDTDHEAAIDTGDDSQQADNSGAAPVQAIPDDNSGAAPVVGAQPADPHPGYTSAIGGMQTSNDQTPGWTPGEAVQGVKSGVQGGAKRLMAYLMGDGADPSMIDKAATQVDPQGQMDPNDRNLLAIDQMGDFEAQWKLLQAHRVAYNYKQGVGFNAMQKGDVQTAIKAANEAGQNVLDGSSVSFAPAEGGITATVKSPGDEQPQQIALSPDQFKQYLNIGGDGQWDKLMQNKISGTLQKLAGGGQGTDQGDQGDQGGEETPGAPSGASSPKKLGPSKFYDKYGNELAGEDLKNKDASRYDEAGRKYDTDIEARSRKVFPNISQERQRNAWISAQEQKEAELENKKDVANIQGTFRVQGAETNAKGRVGAAHENATGRVKAAELYSAAGIEKAKVALQRSIQQQEATGQRNARTLAEKSLIGKLSTGGSLEKDEQDMLHQIIMGQVGQGGGQQAPAPQQSAPAQAAPAKQMSAHDQQAAAWAKANPNDPRAAQIMQKLGAQ